MAEKPTYEELEKRIQELEQTESKRKQMEYALKKSEKLYRLLAENVTDIIWTMDMDLNFTYYSPSITRLQGFTVEEALARSIEESMTPASFNASMKAINEELEMHNKGQKPLDRSRKLDVELFCKDGSTIWTEVEANFIYDANSQPQSIIGVTRDITERKKAEEALQESEERFRTLFEEVPAPIQGFGPDGTVHYWNKASENSFGYTKDEAIGKNIIELTIPPEMRDLAHDALRKGVETGELSPPQEYSAMRKGGSLVPVFSCHVILKRGVKEPELYCLDVDMAVQKKLRTQLKQAHKMESIGTLTGGIAHDFNNILSIIIVNTELALDDVSECNPAHKSLENIKTASLRAAGIVKQLLNFSRQTDEKLKPIDAIYIIKDALKLLRTMIPSTIEMHVNIPAIDITILSDPIQINQILMNICTNASQAMEETGGILEVSVDNVTLNEEAAGSYPDLSKGDYIKITVSDTGSGIDPAILDKIFDPYFTTKEIGKGSGMGLAVAHGIVGNHSGAITVDSELGKGTTFNILFPVFTEKPEIKTEITDGLLFGTETILFVDDEKSAVKPTKQMLKRLGYKVETKTSSTEALELFKSKPDDFDLVITDMTMPQMTGAKLFKKLKEVCSNIPVIICTGHSSLIDEQKAKEMGIAAYVMKPIVKHEIAKIIRTVLDRN